jgi:hypothetical protein
MPLRKRAASPDQQDQLAADADGFAAVYVLWAGADHADMQHSPIGGPYIPAEVCQCGALVIAGRMAQHLDLVRHGA